MMVWNNITVIKKISLTVLLITQFACGGGSDEPDAGVQYQDLPIAYVKRPTPRDNNGDIIQSDLREPSEFNPGGDLYLRARASSTARTINITSSLTLGIGDVKDVEVNYEGTKLIFSMHLDGANETWDLYEYDIPSKVLSRVFTDIIAKEGDDITPAYLADGRIIFSSTRQEFNKGLMQSEGKPQYSGLDERRREPAFVLHVINFDGEVKQISFNQSHDLDPMVLENSGRVLFSRWNNMGSKNEISLYSMNPDGTDLQMHYGSHSHNTGSNNNTIHFTQPRETSDNKILSIIRPFTGTFSGGDIIKIDTNNYADNTQAVWSQQGYLSGPAQAVVTKNVTSGNALSAGGRYASIYPIGDGDGRALVSWSQCQIHITAGNPNSRVIPCTLASQAQLTNPNILEAAPAYGIYLMDFNRYTQIPVVIPEFDTVVSDVVTAYKKTTPKLILDKTNADIEIDEDNQSHGVGVLHIRSVYDFDGLFNKLGSTAAVNNIAEMADPTITISANERPARFIRIIKAVSIPDSTVRNINNSAFGISTEQGMREILGYAPIEPDGSVKVKVPANVPFTFSILDKEGRRIRGLRNNNTTRTNQRHQYWLQVKPGETLNCVGCHYSHDNNNPQNSKPHGRSLNKASLNNGASQANLAFPYSMSNLWAESGETMAEARARHSCINGNDPNDPCPEMKLDIDLVYNDVWTDPADATNMALMPARIADSSYSRRYAALTTAKPFTSPNNCKDVNDITRKLSDSYSLCRIVINYEAHIEPLWIENRISGTCVSCHNQANNITLTPAGQLDLVSPVKAAATDQLSSFNELLRNTPKYLTGGAIEQTQQIINGVPQFVLDVNGNPTSTPIMVNATYPPSMSRNGARISYFIEKMTATELDATKTISGLTDHSNMMSADELKLISEWLDIGAQYFNNPIEAPTN